MFNGKTVHIVLSFVFYSSVTVFGQWSAATSGTTNNLSRGYLLDSGVGFVVGDVGTIAKTTDAIARTTDAGMNWSTLFFDQSIEGIAFPTTPKSLADFSPSSDSAVEIRLS